MSKSHKGPTIKERLFDPTSPKFKRLVNWYKHNPQGEPVMKGKQHGKSK